MVLAGRWWKPAYCQILDNDITKAQRAKAFKKGFLRFLLIPKHRDLLVSTKNSVKYFLVYRKFCNFAGQKHTKNLFYKP